MDQSAGSNKESSRRDFIKAMSATSAMALAGGKSLASPAAGLR